METKDSMREKLVAKAEEDSDFRGRLLADPASVLNQDFGITVPADFNLVVHEDDARTAHLVLPASSELTDAQLQQAAGGGDCAKFSTDWV